MPSVDKSDDKDAASDDKAENIWGSILTDVQSGSQTKLTTSKSVVILGDNESGKTTLVCKLQGVEDQKKGSALEFMYVTVRDEYGDDQSRLSVWLVDGDVYCRGLLKFALTEENFAHSCVLLVASLTRPWDVLDSLTRWSDVLATHVHRLKLGPQVRRQQEDAILRQFQDYVKPDDGASAQVRSTATSADSDGATSSLGDNTLTVNLGIPIVVVLTKSDAVSSLEKDNDYRDEHFDFIQQHEFPKLSQSYYALLECLAQDHMPFISNLEPTVFLYIMATISDGLTALDTMVCTGCCATLDNIISYLFKKLTRKQSKPASVESDTFLRMLELHPDILQQMLSTVLNIIMFEDCRNQWSMSRPLLGLILLNEEYFAKLREEIISSLPAEKQASMVQCFTNLMDGIDRTLLTKNRDRFTQNLSVFRHEINDSLKGPGACNNCVNLVVSNDMMS